jgi:hypothetical protein
MLAPRKKAGWSRILGIVALPILWIVSKPFRDAIQRLIEGTPVGSDAAPGPAAPPDLPGGTESSTALGYVLTLFLFVLVVGTLLLILYMARRAPAYASSSAARQDRLVQVLSLGLEDLQHINSPRAAVIACYSRLQAVADSVEARRVTDTPAELMETLVGRYEVNSFDVGVLTSLFERAKFSTHEIDEGMRAEALRALTDVRSQLEGS